MNIINNYSIHKSDLGRNTPPKNLALLSVGWNCKFLEGIRPLFPLQNTPALAYLFLVAKIFIKYICKILYLV